MSRIPGLDVFDAPGPPDRPSNIFDNFFPIPDNIGKMRTEEEFLIHDSWTLKAPIHVAKGSENSGNLKKVILVIHKETQNPDEELKDILHEMRIITQLNHENVLKFYEIVSGTNLTDVCFVFEPVGGLMSDLIEENIEKLYEPPVIKKIMKDLFTALAYLHQNRIIHRDIQPENIALSSNGILKVWNFRNARKFGQKPKKIKVNEFRYQSVDVLMMSQKYDESVDIWAATCIFAQLWLKKSLFPVHGRETILAAIFKLLGFPAKDVWEDFYSLPGVDNVLDFGNYYKYNMIDLFFKKYCDRVVPSAAMDLMHKGFRYNPTYRPNAEQCLVQSYFYEEPEACPVEEIISVLEHAAIGQQIKKIRKMQSV